MLDCGSFYQINGAAQRNAQFFLRLNHVQKAPRRAGLEGYKQVDVTEFIESISERGAKQRQLLDAPSLTEGCDAYRVSDTKRGRHRENS
jgi:hypothetical protein